VKFLAITLIVHAPDPVTGVQKSTQDRFREVTDNALLAEELGFDGFGVGERHERPFISSSPTVVLSHLAALTQRIRLFTAVTTLSLLDPVRAYEEYATLDHLSQVRLELIIGKGNGAAQRELFHVTPEDQWDRNAESYELFRRIWRQDKVTYASRFRPELNEAEVWPRPLQQPIRIWHGSATSRESVDLAARYGDPLFSANGTNPIEPYAELIRYYRERWEHYATTRPWPPSARARPATTRPAHRRRLWRPTDRSSRAAWLTRSSAVWNRSSPPWTTSSSAAPP
jgi:alkanesulfonate monooxygenase SsuD/methylene tetrahydromethanopterin reductase-like flavin-dependent oxidoreductase (luciferase family)